MQTSVCARQSLTRCVGQPARVALRAAPQARKTAVRAEEGFNLDKVIEDLPVPVEYAYAGVSWGTIILLFNTPFGFLSKSLLLLHILAAATSVARLGAIARPDQTTGEAEATKEFGKGLLIGPFNVGWLGVERFYTKK